MKVLADAGPAAWLLRTILVIPLIDAVDRPSAAFFFFIGVPSDFISERYRTPSRSLNLYSAMAVST